MSINTSHIKKILVISLSNIGDIVLTLPVVDVLKQDFPDAQLSMVVGPKGESLLKGNPFIHKLHIFDKHQAIPKSARWILQMRKERFDLIVDLRNTAFPLFIGARHKTSLLLKRRHDQHMRCQHLNRLRSVYPFPAEANRRYALNILHEDKRYVDDIIKKEIGAHNRFIVMSPGAADECKRWTEEGFARLSDRVMETYKVKVVFVGNADDDRKVIQRITKRMSHNIVNLSGQTTLIQLAHLFRRCALLIVNDTGAMHLASYLDVPVLGLFGPTDPFQYKPWGAKGGFIRKEKDCPACTRLSPAGGQGTSQSPPKSGNQHQCMQAISAEDVFNALELTPEGVTVK